MAPDVGPAMGMIHQQFPSFPGLGRTGFGRDQIYPLYIYTYTYIYIYVIIFPTKILNDYPTLSWMFIDCYCERDEPLGNSPVLWRHRLHSGLTRQFYDLPVTRLLKKGNSELIKMDAHPC
jgi:hypothetical protein